MNDVVLQEPLTELTADIVVDIYIVLDNHAASNVIYNEHSCRNVICGRPRIDDESAPMTGMFAE